MPKVIMTGLEHLKEKYWKGLRGRRLGLLSNQASVDLHLRPAKEVISALLPGHLKALFTSQHGYGAEEQDNMNETDHAHDKELNVPIFSLYSDTRDPSPQMLELVDVLLIDLQDVGCRVYTFASTMLNCMKATSRSHKKVIVLDRPNPLGGIEVEGNPLKPPLFSFVGPYRLPMRHGLTMGEMAVMFKDVFQLDCELQVIPMRGWTREMLWEDTGLTWVMPSPNMPLPQTAYVYPGQVIWEGTNISEGRGTCRPFEIFGAPFLNPDEIRQDLSEENLEGFVLQSFRFKPMFNKWQGKLCHGFFIHLLNPRTYRPYRTTLMLLKAIASRYGEEFQWASPPYEYVTDQRPIDLIIGDYWIDKWLQSNLDITAIEMTWQDELNSFQELRLKYLLY